MNKDSTIGKLDFRTYRAEKTYAVTSGKWYFEVEVQTMGSIRVGWANVSFSPSFELGGDEHSYAFDVCSCRKASGNSVEAFGKQVSVNVSGFELMTNDLRRRKSETSLAVCLTSTTEPLVSV